MSDYKDSLDYKVAYLRGQMRVIVPAVAISLGLNVVLVAAVFYLWINK